MKLCLLLSRRTWPIIWVTFRGINHRSQPPGKSEYFHPFCSLVSLLALSLSSSSMCLSITSESEIHSIMSNSLWPHGLQSPWNSPGQNTGVGSLSLLLGIFQGLNPGLLHCRQILYQLSHKGNPLHSITSTLHYVAHAPKITKNAKVRKRICVQESLFSEKTKSLSKTKEQKEPTYPLGTGKEKISLELSTS